MDPEFLSLLAAIAVIYLFAIILGVQSAIDEQDSRDHQYISSFLFGVIAGILAIIVFLRGLEYFS